MRPENCRLHLTQLPAVSNQSSAAMKVQPLMRGEFLVSIPDFEFRISSFRFFPPRRGTEAVITGAPRKRLACQKRARGFESHPLRQLSRRVIDSPRSQLFNQRCHLGSGSKREGAFMTTRANELLRSVPTAGLLRLNAVHLLPASEIAVYAFELSRLNQRVRECRS